MDQQPVYQQVAVYDARAFQACQDIKPNKSFNKMKIKKNCFRDFVLSQQRGYQKVTAYDARAFQACQDIKPNKRFNKMKLKKNCFRDLVLS